jgi:hypothetical protein
MKRRNFVRSLLVAPAGTAVLAAQEKPKPPVPAQAQVTPKPTTSNSAKNIAEFRRSDKIPTPQLTGVDETAQTTQQFFNAAQIATLGKLAAVLVPPGKDRPGAVEAGAPTFLDFLISASAEDRQKLYCSGLDALDAQASSQFHKPFAELDDKQADAIIRPLLVARPWPEDYPDDPLKSFMAHVHEDLQTATANSLEWAESSKNHPFARGRGRSSGFYVRPIDPLVGS